MLICICCVTFITRLRVSFCIKFKKKKNKEKRIITIPLLAASPEGFLSKNLLTIEAIPVDFHHNLDF